LRREKGERELRPLCPLFLNGQDIDPGIGLLLNISRNAGPFNEKVAIPDSTVRSLMGRLEELMTK